MIAEIERQQDYARRQRELNEEFSRQDLAQENADLAEVLGTEAGRRLFSGIIGRGYVFATVFEKTGGDAVKLAYETGRREFAAKIYQKANLLQPALVLKAIEERNRTFAERKRHFDALKDKYEERTGR